ncbi:HTTM domain-containing protein [Natronorubrum halophilum]|uniref:HTTM domain-containing protein n=1 Tax=Natronorubrum halophilum TaxID=1702106 RepID=UPI000EF6DD6B|nr:HTTM domain-containing protein [Natronorubrum halophilum]
MGGELKPTRGQSDAETVRSLEARLESVRGRVRSRFEIDTRALATLRIALGLILFVDLLHRARHIGYFYTDDGVYPVAVYEATSILYDGHSIHGLSGELWFQQLLFAVAAVFAVALMLGYRTRLVAFVSLLLLVSLQVRNPLVLNGADRLLRVLLLVSILVPLGERWSIDALRRGTVRTTVVGFTTAAMLVQPVAVLTQNAVLKHGGETWYAGDALGIALANDVMTIHLGNHLGNYPALLELLNWIWVTLLAGSVVFLLMTTGRVRAVFALAYIGAFLGMLPTMAVGLFPLVLIAAVLPFLTTPFWDAAASLFPSHRWSNRLPTAAHLGPIGRPPVERRVLEALRRRGHESGTSFVVAYGRSLKTIVGIIFLVWILLFSASHATGMAVPDEIESNFPDEQRWGLYTPDPSESYSWYVVEAEMEDGSTLDVFTGGDVVHDRPPDAAQEYETFRHRKYMESVHSSASNDPNGMISEEYTDWLCETATDEHGDEVEKITVYRHIQQSPVDGEYEEPNYFTLIDQKC